MAKSLDYIFLTIIVFILTFVWTSLAFANWIVSLIMSITLSALAMFTILRFTKGEKRPYSVERLEFEFCLQGNEYVINLIKSIIKNDKIENGSNYIILENSILIANFKFSNLTLTDICAVCNLAKKYNRSTVFLMTRGIDRKAYQVSQLKNIKINVVKSKEIFKYLKQNSALPDLKQIHKKFSLSGLLQTILSRTNFKAYILSGVVLILTSYLTPMRIYYLVFGSLMLLLALLCLTPLANGSIKSPKVFEELQKQIDYQKNQDDDNK